jgi:hypothetical protein
MAGIVVLLSGRCPIPVRFLSDSRPIPPVPLSDAAKGRLRQIEARALEHQTPTYARRVP